MHFSYYHKQLEILSEATRYMLILSCDRTYLNIL